VGQRFELRFAGDGFGSQSVETPSGLVRTGGHSDAEIGAKWKFLDQPAVGFDMAVIPFLSLPTAADGFGTTGYDPGFKLTVARELPRGFGLSGNFNAASVTSEAGRAWEREASVSLGHGFGGAWGAYWETYGSFSDGGCDCTVNTGVTHALGHNGQVDVEVGRGVSGNAQDWFVGVGLAVRRLHR
jgi:Putative MetA-pathway of phenol degradation